MGRGQPGNLSLMTLDKLETIIQLLRMMLGVPPSQALAAMYPDLDELYRRRGTSVDQQRRTNKLLELITAAELPSAPENVQTYVVGIVEQRLASNMSRPLMRVDVTNLNVAQPLLVSKRGVIPSAGGMITARTTQHYVLPQGAEIWGIVNLGNIIVTVGVGYDIQSILAALLDAEEGART